MTLFLTQSAQDFDPFTIVEIILIVYGAYSVLAARKMAQDHKPPQWLLSAQELPRVKDAQGFCSDMKIPTIVFGIGCMGYGIIGMILDFCVKNSMANMPLLIAFIIVVIWFVAKLQKAKRTYVR